MIQEAQEAIQQNPNIAKGLGPLGLKAMLVVLYLLFMLVLAWGYRQSVLPMFAYEGFRGAVDPAKGFAGAILVALFVASIDEQRAISSLLLHFVAVLIVVPTCVLAWVGDGSWEYFADSALGFAVLLVGARVPVRHVLRGPSVSWDLLMGVLLAAVAMTVAAVIALGGVRTFNLDLRKVYEFRTEAARDLPGVFGYIWPIVSKALIPLGLAISLHRKRWLWALALLVATVGAFGLTSHKAVLFYPVFGIASFLLAGFPRRGFSVVVVGSAVAGIAAMALGAGGGLDDIGRFAGSVLLRRALFVPAQLNGYYIEFFSSAPHLWWADSRITMGLLTKPYDVGLANVIGYYYFGTADMGANTGWIGSGFAHGGLLGIVLYSAALGMVLAYLDAVGRAVDKRVLAAAVVPVVLTPLVSSDLVTSLLTHGLLVTLLLLSVIPTQKVAEGREQ